MANRKEHYNNKGLYVGYDKNHKERDNLDYYSTPIEEVTNILECLNIDFSNQTILEPQCGGMHMVKGIIDYLEEKEHKNVTIMATDVQHRDSIDYGAFSPSTHSVQQHTGAKCDFLSNEYPYTDNIDWIICNPPYATIEPHTMKALSIAERGIIMLGRLQFLEGEKRYNNILKDFPPTDIYVYVDRISCFKGGDTSQKMASAQAYAWFAWDFSKKEDYGTQVHWIRRTDKK